MIRTGSRISQILGLFLMLTIVLSCSRAPNLESLFTERGIDGSIIISSLDGAIQYGANLERASAQYLPASTFKILNTLIALDEGAVSGPEEIFIWDGKERFLPAWNQDQTLHSAFPISCVWVYQELAQRIGNDTYLKHLEKIGYGNMKTGPELTTFWLTGDLEISSLEQIDFLKKVYHNTLPYMPEHLELLKELLLIEATDAYILRAKTGWTARLEKQHGWYVGYVETNSEVWFFATNTEIRTDADAKYRKDITMEALTRTGIIPNTP